MRAIDNVRCTVIACGAVALSSTACATARLNDFTSLSAAGTAYVTATQAVLDTAADAVVTTDTAILITARPTLNPNQRRTRLQTSNDLLRERLTLLSAGE